MKTIAITGASGFLGSELVDYFASQGWKVVALVRQPKLQPARKHVSYLAYDLETIVAPSIFTSVDVLVHAAFIKQDRQHPYAYQENVQAAERLLTASRHAKVKHKIFVSSMSSHEGAVSIYGRQKLAIEKLFNQAGEVSLRAGLLIGNGGIVKTMADFMRRKHVVPLVGGGRQPLQIVNVSDMGPVIVRTIERSTPAVLTIATPEVYSYKYFYTALAKQLNVWVLFVSTPFVVLLAALRLAGWLHLPTAVNVDSVLGLKKLIAVDNRHDLELLDIALDDLETSLSKSHLTRT